jgi:hypothetical protein
MTVLAKLEPTTPSVATRSLPLAGNCSAPTLTQIKQHASAKMLGNLLM